MFDLSKGSPRRQEVLADLRQLITSVTTRGDQIGPALRPEPVRTRPDPAVGVIDVPDDAGAESVFDLDLRAGGWRNGSPTADPGGRGMIISQPGVPLLERVGTTVPTRVPDPSVDSVVVPVPAPLATILPRGGLPRGAVVSLAGGEGITSLLLSLIATPRAWSALVGMPEVGLLAAAELGVDLDRLVVIPEPGPDVLQILSVLADGVDLIAVAPPPGGFTAPARLRVLTGRLRQRGAVLLVTGGWPGADLVLRTHLGTWSGVGQGHGRLKDRELTVEVRGRGAAGRHRSVTMLLQSSRTQVEVLPATLIPTSLPMLPATSLLAADAG